MSDGADPSHGPYRGNQKIDLEEWCEEFIFNLTRRGLINPKQSGLYDEVHDFAIAIVNATRNNVLKSYRK